MAANGVSNRWLCHKAKARHKSLKEKAARGLMDSGRPQLTGFRWNPCLMVVRRM